MTTTPEVAPETGPEVGVCVLCGQELVRTPDRTYHPWTVARACPNDLEFGRGPGAQHWRPIAPIRDQVATELHQELLLIAEWDEPELDEVANRLATVALRAAAQVLNSDLTVGVAARAISEGRDRVTNPAIARGLALTVLEAIAATMTKRAGITAPERG